MFRSISEAGSTSTLLPPPGLSLQSPTGTDGLIPPPGLNTATEKNVACEVVLSGLPNIILSDIMFTAVIEQAECLDALVSFSTWTGKPCGGASVFLSCADAAGRCVKHFRGCEWDKSGIAVDAQIQSVPVAHCDAGLRADARPFEPAVVNCMAAHSEACDEVVPEFLPVHALAQEACSWTELCSNFLKLDTWQCTPADELRAHASLFEPQNLAVVDSSLSRVEGNVPVDLPAFVRVTTGTYSEEKMARCSGSSDASTDAGDSEADDDRYIPVKVSIGCSV